jgi:predicted dehydrogenase
MTSQPLRIGIVGCGSVMQYPYTRQIRRMRANGVPLQVTRACDIVPEREPAVRQRFPDAAFSTDYRSVVEAADVDLVLVLTAMPMHGPISKAALEKGKHVLVEKPMATSLEEAAELVELAKRGPAKLHPAPHVVLSPTFQAIWRRIKRGDIGQPLQARALYGWDGPSWGQWFYGEGGGPLFDLGVYNVVSLTALLGPARRVTAFTGIARPERVVDNKLIKVQSEDTAHVVIDHGNAVFSVVSTGFTMQKYRVPGIEIYGSEGTIQMLGEDWDPNGYELWQNKVGAWQVFDETEPDWPWTDGLRHFIDVIQQGEKQLITPEHGFHALEIMIKAKEAGRSGQAQLIESTFTPPSFALPGEEEPQDLHRVHDRVNQGAGLL